jgi:MFS family permease
MFSSGLADIGMIITSMALIASQSSPSQRGALAGVYSLFGAVGIIVTSKVGGYLFDSYSETSSFAVVFLSNSALLVFVLLAMAFRHQIGY